MFIETEENSHSFAFAGAWWAIAQGTVLVTPVVHGGDSSPVSNGMTRATAHYWCFAYVGVWLVDKLLSHMFARWHAWDWLACFQDSHIGAAEEILLITAPHASFAIRSKVPVICLG